MTIPTGTLTFLFTDIEQSTQLWETHPESMEKALKQHDDLLRSSIETHDGFVFKTVGDAFYAAFASASSGLSAAIDAQRAIRKESWPEAIGQLHVRMALHTGTAQERDGDYFGPPLNRVARLEAAGHGGQILLSTAVQELVRDDLPSGVSLIELGLYRLKDLFRPERIFQVVADDLPSEFPSLRTLDTRLNNLPAQPTPFIGRERELNALITLLRRDDVRLVTVTGPGGTGKTRLTLQAAADLLDEYEHGVWFVDLSAVRDPQRVASTIAATLQVKDVPGTDLKDSLTGYLADRQILLVIDNFEQVIEAAEVIGGLLAAAPKLKVMVSSREVLRVYGEHDYPVPPLGLPEKRRKQTVAVLSQYEAVRLFIDRAKAVRPDFEVTEDNAPAIAEICVKLDGLPLAIELAAARSRILKPEAILERLSDRLKTLTTGARDLPTRQRTLRGAIDWSFDLLSEGEKILFVRLGVFSGGWTLDAAEAICSDGLDTSMLDGLESLLEKSMIRETGEIDNEPLFNMLETIREYAAEKLDNSDEAANIHQQHAAYFSDQIEYEMGRGDLSFNRVFSHYPNLTAAMRWSTEGGQSEYGLRIAHALWRHWFYGGNWQEGKEWMEKALAAGSDQPPLLRSRTIRTLGNLLMSLGAEQREVADKYQQALALSREADDARGIAASLNNLGLLAYQTGQTTQARAHFQEMIAINQKNENLGGVATGYHNLGNTAQLEGDLEQAQQYYEQAYELGRKVKQPGVYGPVMASLAELAIERERFDVLRGYLGPMIESVEDVGGAPLPRVSLLVYHACLAQVDGHSRTAVRLLSVGQRVVDDLGLDLSESTFWEYYKVTLEKARAALSPADYEEAWGSGQSTSLDEAIQLAAQLLD